MFLLQTQTVKFWKGRLEIYNITYRVCLAFIIEFSSSPSRTRYCNKCIIKVILLVRSINWQKTIEILRVESTSTIL